MPPIMRDCDGEDNACIPLKGTRHGLACLNVPDPDGLVVRARDDMPPITRECNGSSVCPSNRPEMVWPVSTSQMRTVLLPELEMTRFPSCENVMEVTLSMWSQLLITVGYQGLSVCQVHCHESVYFGVVWVQLGCTGEHAGHGRGQRWVVGCISAGWDV